MIEAHTILQAYSNHFKINTGWRMWFATKILGLDIQPFFFADAKYPEADWDIIRDAVEASSVDRRQYIAESFDCDDFSFAMMGDIHADERTWHMPIFVTWIYTDTYAHALLSFYYEGVIYFIEPQTDQIYIAPKDVRLGLLCG